MLGDADVAISVIPDKFTGENLMRSFVGRHRISIFFILTFIFSWFPWYAGIAPEVINLGPSVAAFFIVIFVGGRRGLLDFLRPFGRWRASPSLWAVAIFGPAALYLIGLGVYLLMGGEAPPFTMIRTEMNLIPLYLLVVLMPWQGPVGEEFGWRGFALPNLQNKYGPLIASLVIGFAWGLWHLPTLFAPLGVLGALASSMGVFKFMLIYVLGTTANSIYMTWLYNKTNASALIAGIVWHAATNFWAPILLSDSSLEAARQGTHLPTIAPSLYVTVLAVQVIGAIALTLVTRGRLGYEGASGRENRAEGASNPPLSA
jgi:membrane protease YdiL (CAAX protease family)